MSAITSRLSTQAAYTGQRGQEEVKYIRKAAKALKTVTEHGLCKVGEQWPTVKLQDITRNIKDTRGRLDYLTLNNVHLLSKLKARVFDAETVNHAAEKYMEDIDQLKEQIEANKRQFDAADKTFNRDIKMLKEIVAEAVQNPQVARILYADQKHVQVALDTMKARWEESDQHLSNLESQVLNFSKDTRYKASRALLKYVEPWRIQTEQRLEELECDVNGITVTVQAQQELKEQLAIEIRNNSALQLDHDSSIASAEDLRVQMTQALDDMTIQLAVMTTNFGILQIDHDSSIASAKDLHIQTTQAMDDMDKQLAEEVEKNSALQIAHDSLITRGEDLRVQTVQAMDDIKKQLVEEVTKNSALQIAHDALTTRVEDLRLHTAQTIEVVTNQLTMETKDKIAVQLAYDGLIKHASDQQTEAEENISRVSNQLLAETEKLNKLQIAYDDLVKHTADVQTETNDTLNRVSDQLAFETERSNKLQIANDGLIQQDADLKIKADETFNRISNHLALETEKSKAIEAEYQTCVTRNRAAMKDNQDEISHISNQLALETEKSIRLQNAHDNLIARVEDLQAQVERKEQEILSCKRDHNTDVLALRAEITELEESKSDTEFMLLSNQMETAAAEQKLRETLSAATLTIGELRESLSANELTRAADDVERLHRDAREAEERQREEVERLHHDAREAEQEQRQREEIERLQRDARDAEERQHKEVERLHHDAREAEQRTDQVKHKHAEEINGFNVQVQTHATEKESLLRQVRELGDESTKMVEEHKAVVLDLQIKYQNAVRRLLRPIIQRVTKSTVEPSKEIIKRYILVEKLSTGLLVRDELADNNGALGRLLFERLDRSGCLATLKGKALKGALPWILDAGIQLFTRDTEAKESSERQIAMAIYHFLVFGYAVSVDNNKQDLIAECQMILAYVKQSNIHNSAIISAMVNHAIREFQGMDGRSWHVEVAEEVEPNGEMLQMDGTDLLNLALSRDRGGLFCLLSKRLGQGTKALVFEVKDFDRCYWGTCMSVTLFLKPSNNNWPDLELKIRKGSKYDVRWLSELPERLHVFKYDSLP